VPVAVATFFAASVVYVSPANLRELVVESPAGGGKYPNWNYLGLGRTYGTNGTYGTVAVRPPISPIGPSVPWGPMSLCNYTRYATANPTWAAIIIRYMWRQLGWFSVAVSSSGFRTMSQTV
jgi:hypothetical protein